MAAEEFDIQKKYEKRKEEERKREKGLIEDKKRVVQILKILCNAGLAKPGVPLGPIFGQHQLSIADFCKEFNRLTVSIPQIFLCSAYVLKCFDKTFTIILRGVILSSYVFFNRFVCNFTKVNLAVHFIFFYDFLTCVFRNFQLTIFFRLLVDNNKHVGLNLFVIYPRFLRLMAGFLRSAQIYLF